MTVRSEQRLFNILLRNIPYAEWPKELSATTGFPMHDAPLNSTKLGDFTDPDDSQFRKQIRFIVDAIDQTLNQFPQETEESPKQDKTEPIKIFLADVPDSLANVREQLAEDLKSPSVEILSYIPPPLEYEPHQRRVTETVEKADLTVHLLDELPGRKIDDYKTATYPQSQTEIALNFDRPQLIWVPKDVVLKNIKAKPYADFLNNIATKAERGKKYNFVKSLRTELTENVRQMIIEIQNKRQIKKITSMVLLDTHEKDQRCAFQLADFLTENGVKIEFNQDSIDPDLSITLFEKAIQHVQNLVIVFGEVDQTWVKRRVQKAIKLVVTQFEQASLQNCWIYVTPPQKPIQQLFHLPELFHIN